MEDAFQTFAKEYATYGYPVLFLGVLLENAGIPVPGETAVLVAGFLASPAGGGHFDLALVIGLTLVAAVVGDNLGYWLGHRWARPRLQSGRRFLFLTPTALQMAEGYFERYGLWTIFFARFITGLRVIGALAAGTAGMPWPRFLAANAAGALAWSVTMALLGYFFGHSWELLHRWLGRGGLIALGCVIVLVSLPYLLRRLRHMPFGQLGRFVRAQIWQGILAAVLEVICLAVLVALAQRRHINALDRGVETWLNSWTMPFLDVLTVWGNQLGILPVVALVTVVMLLQLRYAGRSWREQAAMLWALVASELVGLLLVGLLRSHHVEPVRAAFWPFGYVGSVPLRAFAVWGMAGQLLIRQHRTWGIGMHLVSAVVIFLSAFSGVWGRQQTFTETLLELAAGTLVLFAGIWWLEGYGPGLIGSPSPDAPGTPEGPQTATEDAARTGAAQ